MICALCGTPALETAAFCAKCGVLLGVSCPACAASNNPHARRCGGCGIDLQISSHEAPKATRAPRESRRIVTVLFADIVGFTMLVESHTEQTETVRSMLQESFDALAANILDQGGIVEKFIGDAICALFGAPAVHEDDPERALRCALEMQRTIGEPSHSGSASGSDLPPLQLRIGVSTGEVVGGTAEHGGQEQYSVTGDAVNTASRLQAAASPGQILVAASTERLTRDRFHFESAGELKLKGKRSPVGAYLLSGVRASAIRSDQHMVNRRKELEHLSYCLHLAAEGRSQLVEITGDAGVGKSCLVDAFCERAEETAVVCRGSCPPSMAVPLFPFVSIARGLLSNLVQEAIADDSDLAGAVNVLNQVVDETVATVAEEPLEEIVSAIHAIIGDRSHSGPVVMVMENVHRADQESLDVLQRVIARAKDERLLLLWTRRTGEEMVGQGDYAASFTRMALGPLADHDAEELLQQLLGDVALPVPLYQTIIERSGGNPLYIEAMVRTLLEEPDLIERQTAEGIEIPNTVHGLVQSRLDRLPEPQRLAAQQAAVAGREFDARLLQAVDLFGIEISPALDALARQGIVDHVGGSTYRFRHVLTQEVSYETMLQGLRAELHREIADTMPELFPDQLAEMAPARADHYAKAGDTDRAVEVLVEAGAGQE